MPSRTTATAWWTGALPETGRKKKNTRLVKVLINELLQCIGALTQTFQAWRKKLMPNLSIDKPACQQTGRLGITIQIGHLFLVTWHRYDLQAIQKPPSPPATVNSRPPVRAPATVNSRPPVRAPDLRHLDLDLDDLVDDGANGDDRGLLARGLEVRQGRVKVFGLVREGREPL